MTICHTAKKLGVSTYDYIMGRVSGECKLPSLAHLIEEKAREKISAHLVP